MRYFEIAGGFRVPASADEMAILSLADGGNDIARNDLNDRQNEIARTMVSRGLLRRFKKDEVTFFRPNADDTWRI
jgi:hypothetical protein